MAGQSCLLVKFLPVSPYLTTTCTMMPIIIFLSFSLPLLLFLFHTHMHVHVHTLCNCLFLSPLAEKRAAMGQQWHQKCFRCNSCGRFLDPGRHCEVSKTIISITCCFSFSLQHDGQPYCNTCYNKQFGADGLRTGTSIQPRPHLDPPMSAEER